MQMEELGDFRNQVRLEARVDKRHNEREGAQQYKRLNDIPHRSRFTKYTPFNKNNRILQETLNTELISTPRKVRTTYNANQSY